MYIRCVHDNCLVESDGMFGPNSVQMCLNHGMELLESIRLAKQKERDERCEDGPHCGCPWHTAGRSDDDE